MFICEVLKSLGGLTSVEVSRTILKTQVMGMVTGIKKFPQSVIFCDDGTGTLDCILWLKESPFLEKIFDLKKDVKSGMNTLSDEMKKCARSLLQKAEMSSTGEEQQYSHGDIISCLGNVKVYKGKPQLDIVHHCILYL
ncbi:hypothetical protein JTE90_017255 [Oedothorax gibbosus]|uniref:OB domain-containing protein n=1 Tax=Oedothorax gibbosus TaxID=931172 RepID=A0AAV6VFN2_9ARAC|nr:hypothetical protein JTE90_017255 [Oedothorax gibbosus]